MKAIGGQRPKSGVFSLVLSNQSEEQIHRARSIGSVAVSANLVRVHLADGRSANSRLDMAQALLFEAINYRLHVSHGGGEQRAHANDIGFILGGSSQELVHVLVHPDVIHLEARSL